MSRGFMLVDLPRILENFTERWALALPPEQRSEFSAEGVVLLEEAHALVERSKLSPSEALLFEVRRVLITGRERMWTPTEVLHALDVLVDSKDTEENRRHRLLVSGTALSTSLRRGAS